MATGDFTKSAIDTLTLDAGTCTNPIIVHHTGDVYVVAYAGPDTDGWIQTFSCDSDGALAAIDSLEFDTIDCDQYHIDLKKIDGTTFAVVYRGDSLKAYLKTITIQNDGTITGIVDTWEFNGIGAGWFPKLLQRSGTVWIIVSTDNGSGIVGTTTINNDGTLGKAWIDFTQFLFAMKYVSIAYVSGDFHALVYLNGTAQGKLASLEITAAGQVAADIQHSAQFGTSIEAIGNLLELATNYFAFPFDAANATLQTCSVSDGGACALIDSVNFGSDADWSHVINVPRSTLYAISWAEVSTVGQMVTYDISAVGIITTPYQDIWGSFSSPGDDPFILYCTGNVYMVAFIGSLIVWTFAIETPADTSNDRIYVWLGTVATPETTELTAPAYNMVLGARTERGRDEELGHAAAGIAEITCDNFFDDFSPENSGGTYYGLLQLGAVITVYEIYQAVTYRHFKGKIDSIEPHPELDNKIAFILAVDGMDDLNGSEIETVKRTAMDESVLTGDILDAVGWPAADRNLDSGVDTLAFGWFHEEKALPAIQDLEKSTRMFFLIHTNGYATMQNRHYRVTGDRLTSQFTFNETLVEIGYAWNKRDIKNWVRVTGYKYIDPYYGLPEEEWLWYAAAGDSDAIFVPAGATVKIWAPLSGLQKSNDGLTVNQDWNSNTAYDKSGTDLTADFTVTLVDYGQAIEITIANAGSLDGYLVVPDSPPVGAPDNATLLIYGTIYEERLLSIVEEDSTSQDDYGKRTHSVNARFKGNYNDILSYAQWLISRFKDPIPTPVMLRVNAWTSYPDDTIKIQCLTREISDRITAVSSSLGINQDYYIDKIIQEYIALEGGMQHYTTYHVSRCEGQGEGVYWILGEVGFSELGETTKLGF